MQPIQPTNEYLISVEINLEKDSVTTYTCIYILRLMVLQDRLALNMLIFVLFIL